MEMAQEILVGLSNLPPSCRGTPGRVGVLEKNFFNLFFKLRYHLHTHIEKCIHTFTLMNHHHDGKVDGTLSRPRQEASPPGNLLSDF